MPDLGKSQLNAILSALDGQPRNPNTKDAALRRIGAHAERCGLGLDDLLAAAAGFLDGRMSAESFRTCLQDDAAEAAGRIEPIEDEAACIETPGAATGWLRHTCHGALAGLKKKRGLQIISDKHANGERIYRLAAPVETSGTAD